MKQLCSWGWWYALQTPTGGLKEYHEKQNSHFDFYIFSKSPSKLVNICSIWIKNYGRIEFPAFRTCILIGHTFLWVFWFLRYGYWVLDRFSSFFSKKCVRNCVSGRETIKIPPNAWVSREMRETWSLCTGLKREITFFGVVTLTFQVNLCFDLDPCGLWPWPMWPLT